MARMTKLQVDHLRAKLSRKVTELHGLNPLFAEDKVLRTRFNELTDLSAATVMKTMTKKRIVELLTHRQAIWSNTWAGTIRGTDEHKEYVRAKLNPLEKELKALNDTLVASWKRLDAEAEEVLDSVIFAGADECIQDIIAAFLARRK